MVTIASSSYLQKFGTPKDCSELSNHSLIIDCNFKYPNRWQYRENNQIVSLYVHGKMILSHPIPCLDAAIAGLGITRIPTFIAGPAIKKGDVLPILQEYELPPRALYAVYPQSRHLARKIRIFIDFIIKEFSGAPSWDQY